MKNLINKDFNKIYIFKKEYEYHRRELHDHYYDEGWYYHRPKGRYIRKKRQLLLYLCRNYKSWKHNRRKQYKDHP